jgi:hypothetical protein
MPSINDLEPLVSEPREDLSVEYKNWLDLTANEHRAIVAKAAIALVNHGGGFIVLGMADEPMGLVSRARPAEIPEITQDAINAAIRRYATPEFHVEVYAVPHPTTGVTHPVIAVPGTRTEPVMSKRDCPGVIAQARCYIRKPGPRSEEPQTAEEWRALLNRCVRAGRDDMLEAIRSIVSGRIEPREMPPGALEALSTFCNAARARWQTLTAEEPADAPPRFPHGFYEMGFSLVGAVPATGLADLQGRLHEARRIKLTGWTPFLDMTTPEWAPYPHENFVEAWVGRTVADRNPRTPAHSDFWRASPAGQLYTIRGYAEDELENRPPGQAFDITLPVWRVGEGILFAARLAETFADVEAIAIRCRYTGLNGRALVSVSGDRAAFGDDVSRTDEIVLETQATPEQLRDNLAEVLHQLLTPLYERFAFFRLPIVLVEQELARMVRGRF